MARTTLVTGVAGFIGFHAAQRLLERGDWVIGLDNLNDYYDVTLKRSRLALLEAHESFLFVRVDVARADAVEQVFRNHAIDDVIHLAAQVGVRYSVDHPRAYIQSNISGFLNILEGCRHHDVRHLVYASSSSVYGSNTAMPFSVRDNVDHPISLYAASKKSNELMAHSYSHLFGLPTTGLRFFTVYGPWSRPDMALFLFAQAIVKGRPIDLFNGGDVQRDFTYVDDIVEGVLRTLDDVATPDPAWTSTAPIASSSSAPFRLYNIGTGTPVPVLAVVEELEKCLGKTAKKNLLPMQPGDMQATWAEVEGLAAKVGFQPKTGLKAGVRAFTDWFCEYYSVER